jgi:hypothetical protein
MTLFSRPGEQPQSQPQQKPPHQQSLTEMVTEFGPRARRVISTAIEVSHPYRQLASGALLAALADEPSGGAGVALFESGIRIQPTLSALAALEPPREDFEAQRPVAAVMHRILSAAMEYRRRRNQVHVTTDLMLEALVNESDSVAVAILRSQSVRVRDLRSMLRRIVRAGEAPDDVVFSASGPIVETLDLDYPASLVWALIEPPENVPLLDEMVISGERRFDDEGREIHVTHTRNPAPHDVVENVVTTEVAGRRARILQTLPASLRAMPTTFDLTPVGSGARLRLESFVEVGSLRRRERESAEPELRELLRASLHKTRQVLDEGWRPNADR